MISSGIKEIDSVLDGGLRGGTLLDVFGAAGTGKTQLALQFAQNSLIQGDKVLLHDTTGNFRPERLREILLRGGKSFDLLDSFHITRITSTSDQIKNLDQINEENNFNLVIIDSLTDLFSFEYSKEEQSLDKMNIFMKYMRALSKKAISNKIPIIVTNMIRTVDNVDIENFEKITDLYSHFKVKLTKKGNKFSGMVSSLKTRSVFEYSISSEGLISPSQSI